MAYSDYTTRMTGLQFCPVANTIGPVAPLDTAIPIRSLKVTRSGDMWVGMMAMLGTEIVKVVAIATGSVTIERGCADTIPTAWPAGTEIWFLDSVLRGDNREYLGTATIAVKVLPRTSSGTTAVSAAPAQQITFSSRFVRPYPPGQVRAGGDRWFSAAPALTQANPAVVLTWVHRNRVTQADVLVAHDAASITPEAGTTYALLARSPAGALLGTIDLGAVSTCTVERVSLCHAVGYATGTGVRGLVLWLHSRRDGHDSLHGYPIQVQIDTANLGSSTDITEGLTMSALVSGGTI